MKERKEDDHRTPEAFIQQTFFTANRLRYVDEIPNGQVVVDCAIYPSLYTIFHPHGMHEVQQKLFAMVVHPGNINEKKAPVMVNGHIRDALSDGRTVVIDDRSHGKVIGIRPVPGHKVEIFQKNRFGRNELVSKIVSSPRFKGSFTTDEQGKKNFTLSVCGVEEQVEREISRKKDTDSIQSRKPHEVLQVSSDGENRPRGFVIVTSKELTAQRREEEVIFALQDIRGSLTGVHEYLGPSSWIVKGSSGRQTRRGKK